MGRVHLLRMWATVLFLLLATPAQPDDAVFSVGRCQGLGAPERETLRALDAKLTPRAAQEAASEVRRRLAAKRVDPPRLAPTARELAVTLEGWMVKKAWLGARARHEHDADEAGEYCEFLRREAQLN